MSTSYLVTKRFWTDTAERCVRTFAQTAAAAFGTGAFATAVTSGEWASVPWQEALSVTVLATVLAFFTALAGRATGDPSTASLTTGTEPKPLSGPAGGVSYGGGSSPQL